MLRMLCLRNTPPLWRAASAAILPVATRLSPSPQVAKSMKYVASTVSKPEKLFPPKIYVQQFLRGPQSTSEKVVKTMCTTCRAESSIRDDVAPQYFIADGRYVVRRQPCHGTCDKSSDDVNFRRRRARKYHVPVNEDLPRVFSTSLTRAVRMTQGAESDSVQHAEASKRQHR